MTIQTIITKTALILAATLSTAALANEGDQRRIEVRSSGIDVTQDAGIKLLTERARVAARNLCATVGTVGSTKSAGASAATSRQSPAPKPRSRLCGFARWSAAAGSLPRRKRIRRRR